jgi:hypothetical protein
VPIRSFSNEIKIFIYHSRFKFPKKDTKIIEKIEKEEDEDLNNNEDDTITVDFYNNIFIPWGEKYDFSYLIMHLKNRQLSFFYSIMELFSEHPEDYCRTIVRLNRSNNVVFMPDFLENLYNIYLEQKKFK